MTVLLMMAALVFTGPEQCQSRETPEVSPSTAESSAGGTCNPSTCQLPDCRCVGTDIPGGLPVQDVPQMVLLTFDDEVTANNSHYYHELFPQDGKGPLRNPDGCRTAATFFVAHDWSDMTVLKQLVERGNEVAVHSLTHSLSFDHSWTDSEWHTETVGMRRLLARALGLSASQQVVGWRSPHLELGGEVQFSVLQEAGFLYDSSMYGGSYSADTASAPLWPFTLRYPPHLPNPSAVCDQDGCPSRSYPRLWEVPLVRQYTSDGRPCSMTDSCQWECDVNASDVTEYLRHNFLRHYTSNRAPFMVSLHAKWFSRVRGSFEGLKSFLREMSLTKDVWQITLTQMLHWVRHPRPISRLHELSSWARCSQHLSQDTPDLFNAPTPDTNSSRSPHKLPDDGGNPAAVTMVVRLAMVLVLAMMVAMVTLMAGVMVCNVCSASNTPEAVERRRRSRLAMNEDGTMLMGLSLAVRDYFY